MPTTPLTPTEVYTKEPSPNTRLSKANAGYVAKGPFGCNHCTWFNLTAPKGTPNCAVVGSDVNERGCCDYWNEKDAPQGVGKSKAEYVFVPGSNYTCDECKFFDFSSDTCTPVVGDIAPKASCNKWMPLEGAQGNQMTMTESAGHSHIIRESAREALEAWREAVGAGTSNTFSDGSERGAAQSTPHVWPPNSTEEDGGQKRTPPSPDTERTTNTAEMRGAPQSKGVPPFSTGGPAPMASASPSVGDGKVSNDTGTINMPGSDSEHVSEVDLASYPGTPCATCSHVRGHHILENMTCLWCGPKGSTHKFTEVMDLTPQLVTVPLATEVTSGTDTGDVVLGLGRRTRESAAPVPLIASLRQAHWQMFSEEDRAFIRIVEALSPWNYDSSGNSQGRNVTDQQANSAKSRALVYNAHTLAAHRSSVQAMMGSSPEAHEVAEQHHQLAAGAATEAANAYPEGSHARADFKTAATYHTRQAEAHRAAGLTARRGNTHSRYDVSSSPMDRY